MAAPDAEARLRPSPLPPSFVHRILLLRRRIDPIMLSLAMAGFAIKLKLDMVVFACFIGTGLWLLAIRHRSVARLIDRNYLLGAGLFSAYAIAVGLVHGNFPEEIRWIGYPVYLLAGVLLMSGFVLIRDPLRQIVLGARIGIIVALPIGLLEMTGGDARIGFGGNEANAAFVFIIFALVARHPVRHPPPFLGNSPAWFYLGGMIVVLTGTRAVLPVLVLGAVLDIWRWFPSIVSLQAGIRAPRSSSTSAIVLVAFLAIGGLVAVKSGNNIAERVDYTMMEMSALGGDKNANSGLNLRVALWRNATVVIAEHPLLGSGGVESMRKIQALVPAEGSDAFASFVHVHNFILDELRQRGVIGLALLLAFFISIGARIWRAGDKAQRETLLLFYLALVSYGSLHGLMLGDRNVMLIAIVLSVMLLDVRHPPPGEAANRAERRECVARNPAHEKTR